MHEAPSGPELLTIDEAAALFRVDRSTVSRWAKQGRLRYVRLPNGRIRFKSADIEDVLQYAEPA